MRLVRSVVSDKEAVGFGVKMKNYLLEVVLAMFLLQMIQTSIIEESCTSFIYHIDSLCSGGVSVLRATFNVSYLWSDEE